MVAITSRSIPGAGAVWTDGHYVKAGVAVPSLGFIWTGMKRVIDADQNIFFAEIEALEGIELPAENRGTYYYHSDSIHTGVTVDPNKIALWIDGTEEIMDASDTAKIKQTHTIYATVGAGTFDLKVRQASAAARALWNLFYVMPACELVRGYPANIDNEPARTRLQPEVKYLNKYTINPDAPGGATAKSVGPIATLVIELLITPQANR